jgi:hypothetical protein
MKKLLITSTLFLLIISCGRSNPENKPLVENAVDDADSSIKNSFESGSRYEQNMIDKIYSELIKNDKELSALDDKISKAHQKLRKVLEYYNAVLDKSDDYYQDVIHLTSTINDSVLKHQIEHEINVNSEKYNEKTNNIQNLISKLNKNEQDINSLYTAFKIRKTLPEIEKYQNAHPLKTDSLENFINKQNQLLNELKNLK